MYLCDTRIKISYLIETNNKSSGKNTSFMYKREDYLLQAPDQILFFCGVYIFFHLSLKNSRAQKKIPGELYFCFHWRQVIQNIFSHWIIWTQKKKFSFYFIYSKHPPICIVVCSSLHTSNKKVFYPLLFILFYRNFYWLLLFEVCI